MVIRNINLYHLYIIKYCCNSHSILSLGLIIKNVNYNWFVKPIQSGLNNSTFYNRHTVLKKRFSFTKILTFIDSFVTQNNLHFCLELL